MIPDMYAFLSKCFYIIHKYGKRYKLFKPPICLVMNMRIVSCDSRGSFHPGFNSMKWNFQNIISLYSYALEMAKVYCLCMLTRVVWQLTWNCEYVEAEQQMCLLSRKHLISIWLLDWTFSFPQTIYTESLTISDESQFGNWKTFILIQFKLCLFIQLEIMFEDLCVSIDRNYYSRFHRKKLISNTIIYECVNGMDCKPSIN